MHAYDGHEEMRKRLRCLTQAEDTVRHREQQVSIREEVLNVALSAGIGPDLLGTSVGGGRNGGGGGFTRYHSSQHDFSGGLLSVYDDDASPRQDEMLVDLLVREAIAKVPPPPCVHSFLGVLEERAIEVETLYNSLLHDQERMQGKWRSLDRREREIQAREKQLLGWIGGVERVAGSLDVRTAETHNAAEKQAEEETELVVWSQTMRDKETSLDERKASLDTLQRHLEDKSKQAEIAFQKAIQLQEEAAALRRESEGDQWRRRLNKLVVRSAQTDLTGAVVTDYEAIYERGGSVDPDALLNNTNIANISTLPLLSSKRPFANFTSTPSTKDAATHHHHQPQLGVRGGQHHQHPTTSNPSPSTYRFRSPLASSTTNNNVNLTPATTTPAGGTGTEGWKDPLDSIMQDRADGTHHHHSYSSSPPPPPLGMVDLRLRRSSTVDTNHNNNNVDSATSNNNEGGSYADFLGQDYFLGADAASGNSTAYRTRLKAEMSGVVSELEAEERFMKTRAKKLPNRKDFLTTTTATTPASSTTANNRTTNTSAQSTPTMIPHHEGGGRGSVQHNSNNHRHHGTSSNVVSMHPHRDSVVDEGGSRRHSSGSVDGGSRRGSSGPRGEESAAQVGDSNRPDRRGSYPRKSPPPPPPTARDNVSPHRHRRSVDLDRGVGDTYADEGQLKSPSSLPRGGVGATNIEISEHFGQEGAWPTPNISHIPAAATDDESRIHNNDDDEGGSFAGGGFSRHGRVLPVPNSGGGSLAAAYLPNSSSDDNHNNNHRNQLIPLLPDDGSEPSGTPPHLRPVPTTRRSSSGGSSDHHHPHLATSAVVVSSPTSRSVRFIEGPGMISSIVPPSPVTTPSMSMSPQESDLYDPLPKASNAVVVDYGGYSVGGYNDDGYDAATRQYQQQQQPTQYQQQQQQPYYGGGEDSSEGSSSPTTATSTGILRKRSATGPIIKGGGLPPSSRHHQPPPPPNPPSPQTAVGDVMVDDPLGLGEPEYKITAPPPLTRDAALDDPRRYLSQIHRSDANPHHHHPTTTTTSSSSGGQPPGRRRSSTVTSW